MEIKKIAITTIALSSMLLGRTQQKSPDDVAKKYYALTTVVEKVDRKKDTVTCIDFNGNRWEFYGAGDWLKDDIASLLMYNNDTPESIYDDVIVNVSYDGWMEDFKTDYLYQ